MSNSSNIHTMSMATISIGFTSISSITIIIPFTSISSITIIIPNQNPCPFSNKAFEILLCATEKLKEVHRNAWFHHECMQQLLPCRCV